MTRITIDNSVWVLCCEHCGVTARPIVGIRGNLPYIVCRQCNQEPTGEPTMAVVDIADINDDGVFVGELDGPYG